MKKTTFIRIILPLTLALTLLNACRKGDLNTEDQSITKQVTTWLEQEKTRATATTAAKIQAQKEDLDYSRTRIEELRAGEKIVIVPTRGRYVINNTLAAADRTPAVNHLVLILDKSGAIRKGNIVQYRSEDPNEKTLPDNTFYKLYNDKILDLSGRIRYLDLDEKEQYEYKYTNGRMTAYSIAQKKPKDKIAASIPQDPFGPACIDWYWVTIDTDTGEVISEDYLYTTCPGDGGGGGGGGNGNPPLTALATQKDWIVAAADAGIWKISSTERLEGVKDVNETAGGHFTAITHLGTSLAFSFGADSEWTETGATESVNGSIGTSYVSGTLKFTGTPASQIIISTRSHKWIFTQVFP